jgi:poly(hydroxyalkanoate) depolymerase family esterase
MIAKKFRNSIYFIFLIISFSNASFAQQDLTEVIEFGNNPGRLRMFSYIPKQKNASSSLVVILHGCNQQAADIAELTGWNKIAEETNCVLIYPQQRAVNNPSHCFRWFSEHQNQRDSGEVASIFSMIKHTVQKQNIDPERIFISGFSAGAAMSVSMISVYPELFSAAAVFAGGPYGLAKNIGQSANLMTGRMLANDSVLYTSLRQQNLGYNGTYPSLYTYHGTHDPIVNYKNAKMLNQQWALLQKCDTSALEVQNSFQGNEMIDVLTCYDSNGKIKLRHYRLNKVKHQVPISAQEGGKTGLFTINKGFHSTKQVAIDFGLYELQKDTVK